MWSSNSTPRYIPKGNENIYPHKTYTKNFIAVLFIIAKKWKQLKCSSTDGLKKCGISIQWCIIQSQKGKKHWFMLQHRRFLKTMLKWKDSHKKWHIVWFHVYEMSRRGKSIETESRLVVNIVLVFCFYCSVFSSFL